MFRFCFGAARFPFLLLLLLGWLTAARGPAGAEWQMSIVYGGTATTTSGPDGAVITTVQGYAMGRNETYTFSSSTSPFTASNSIGPGSGSHSTQLGISGTITLTFTWVPKNGDYLLDPAPDKLPIAYRRRLKASAYAYASGSGEWASATANIHIEDKSLIASAYQSGTGTNASGIQEGATPITFGRC